MSPAPGPWPLILAWCFYVGRHKGGHFYVAKRLYVAQHKGRPSKKVLYDGSASLFLNIKDECPLWKFFYIGSAFRLSLNCDAYRRIRFPFPSVAGVSRWIAIVYLHQKYVPFECIHPLVWQQTHLLIVRCGRKHYRGLARISAQMAYVTWCH